MSKCDYTELAKVCKSTITNPANLLLLKPFINSHDPVALLSLYKVFKNIIPLYKISIKEDKIKHKQSYIKLKSTEKSIYNLYKIYVERIKKSKLSISFQIASMLVLELDHFNFAEKMINKVLAGAKDNISCVNAILQKVREDIIGDSTFKIMLALMEFNLCDAVYECIMHVNIVDRLTFENYINIKKDVKSDRKDKNLKLLMNNKYAKSIEKSSLKSRNDKKSDVMLNKINAKLHVEKEKKKEEDVLVVQRKIVDNLMRIFFMILNDKKKSLYKYCFVGLARYKRFIKNVHMSGLMIMLNDVLKEGNHVIRLHACLCIIEIFGDRKFEFRNLMHTLFEVMAPLRYDLSISDKKLICEIIGFLFIKNKQTNKVVNNFIQRMLQLATICYFPKIKDMIDRLIRVYKLDVYDFEIVKNGIYNPECDNIDFVCNHPLYLGPFFVSKYESKDGW